MMTDTLEKSIYRYLLGDLPEEEQFALEQEFLADGDTFEQVWSAENELIDRYVRGKLTPTEKDLFEKNYLASPVHRRRLDFARNLVRAADSSTESEGGDLRTERAWWDSLLAAWRASRFHWALAAAMLVLAAGSGWLLAENIRLREQMDQLRREGAFEQQRAQELEKELEAQGERQRELAAELGQLRAEQSPPLDQTPPDQSGARPVISFFLSPLLMRGVSEPQELRITKETGVVVLKMRIEEPDGRSFAVSLRTVEGAQIWSRVKARALDKKGATVSVSIPADRIPTGDYILTLSARNEANETEEVNRYFLRVIKQ